jgi:hypothetical protein
LKGVSSLQEEPASKIKSVTKKTNSVTFFISPPFGIANIYNCKGFKHFCQGYKKILTYIGLADKNGTKLLFSGKSNKMIILLSSLFNQLKFASKKLFFLCY